MSEETQALKELLESKLDVIADTNKKLVDVVYGNGHDGLLQRTVRIEETAHQLVEGQARNAAERKEEAALAKEAADESMNESKEFRITISKAVDEIKALVIDHHKDTKLHTPEGLLLRKNVLLYIMLAFLVIHTLLPHDINVWNLITKFFGL